MLLASQLQLRFPLKNGVNNNFSNQFRIPGLPGTRITQFPETMRLLSPGAIFMFVQLFIFFFLHVNVIYPNTLKESAVKHWECFVDDKT